MTPATKARKIKNKVLKEGIFKDSWSAQGGFVNLKSFGEACIVAVCCLQVFWNDVVVRRKEEKGEAELRQLSIYTRTGQPSLKICEWAHCARVNREQ